MIAQLPPPPPARVQVVASEFELMLSRPLVRRGNAVVELVNFGQDGHDLALRRLGTGSRTWRMPEIRPGKARDLAVALVPGRYLLWCTLPGHRASGMVATLVVSARRTA